MSGNPPSHDRAGRRGRTVLLVALLALAASACADGTSATPRIDPTMASMAVHLLAQQRTASALLTFQDVRQEGTGGSSCWSWGDPSGNSAGRCVDTTSDVQAPELFTDIPSKTTLFIAGDANRSEGIVAKAIREDGQVRLDVIQHLDLRDGQAVIDVAPGSYTLQITGMWDQGEVPFYFGIRVHGLGG